MTLSLYFPPVAFSRAHTARLDKSCLPCAFVLRAVTSAVFAFGKRVTENSCSNPGDIAEITDHAKITGHSRALLMRRYEKQNLEAPIFVRFKKISPAIHSNLAIFVIAVIVAMYECEGQMT